MRIGRRPAADRVVEQAGENPRTCWPAAGQPSECVIDPGPVHPSAQGVIKRLLDLAGSDNSAELHEGASDRGDSDSVDKRYVSFVISRPTVHGCVREFPMPIAFEADLDDSWTETIEAMEGSGSAMGDDRTSCRRNAHPLMPGDRGANDREDIRELTVESTGVHCSPELLRAHAMLSCVVSREDTVLDRCEGEQLSPGGGRHGASVETHFPSRSHPSAFRLWQPKTPMTKLSAAS